MSVDDVDELRRAFSGLVRSMGLLRPDTTPCGLKMAPSEAHAIVELLDVGPMTPRVLAECLQLEKSTVTRLIDQLHERGWVRRVANKADGRSVVVELTAAGNRAASKVVVARKELFARVIGELSVSERQVVVSSVSRFCEVASHVAK
jgi:DNA-binding MarR family transcriptional regulator